jgi:PKHD-type hydroxylase
VPAPGVAAPDLPAPDVLGQESSYATLPDLFSAAEVQNLSAPLGRGGWSRAEVSRPGEVTLDYRSAHVSWIHRRDAPWVFDRLDRAIEQLNKRWFGFDLAGFHGPLQLTRYDAEDGGHYDWHSDRGTFVSAGPPRKLTAVVQLSDGDAYTGGDLELLFGREPVRVGRAAGSFHVLPSFVLHRVTPVTHGVRLSLVGWVIGPKFR